MISEVVETTVSESSFHISSGTVHTVSGPRTDRQSRDRLQGVHVAALAANGRETLADAAETVLGFQSIRPSVWDDASTSHLARELHDGVAGELSTMLLDLERFRAGQAGRQSALSEIAQLQEQVRLVLSNVRGLLYTQRQLPGIEPDFVGSLRRGLARRYTQRAALRVHVSASRDWPDQIPADTALNLRRIVQEAINNVLRHSGARAVLIRFSLLSGREWGTMKISDDGRGYGGADDGWQPGFGMVGIQERAVLLGARVDLANRSRGGSTLTITIPKRRLSL